MKKTEPYFLRKIKVKKLKCRLLLFWFGALKVKTIIPVGSPCYHGYT